jgi:hypothetical protein
VFCSVDSSECLIVTSNIALVEKKELIEAIGCALRLGVGLAVGKLGYSEQLVLLFSQAIRTKDSAIQRNVIPPLYLALKHHSERQTGIFPTDIEFLTQYAAFYTEQVRRADFLGLFGSPNESKLVRDLPLSAKFLHYTDTEPDRSSPYEKTQCYLPYLRDKKVLLIAPFASFAKQRACKDIFEAVWKNIDCAWFKPQRIEAIDIPYSFLGQERTFKAFGNSLALYDHIVAKIDECDYDIALIAAGSLAIPLTVHIKNAQKVGISLGGHFQALFGILGDRWIRDKVWADRYINQAWVRLPERFIPENAVVLADNKAYW